MITFLQLGRYGRLCNQMFQIASTIGIAVRHGYKYGFPYWQNYDHKERFKSTENIDIQSYFVNSLPLLDEKINYQLYKVPWGYHEIMIADNTNLFGHMQSEKYFSHCHKVIRGYFRFKNSEKYHIDKKSIGVHFRGADYGGDYHPRCTNQYYEKALSQLPGDHKIYVFSDELKTARKIFGSNVEYVETGHSVTDLLCLSKCHHFVICNSSYSWWGAWLGYQDNKKVIAPHIWFGPAARKLETKDIYCNGWVII